MTTIYVTRAEQNAVRELIKFCATIMEERESDDYKEQLKHADLLHQKIKNSRYGGE